MNRHTVITVTLRYCSLLDQQNIQSVRIDPGRSFADLSVTEVLQHARYLCDSVLNLVDRPDKWAKINRHYAALQMCLSFAGWYTLNELMQHSYGTKTSTDP